MSKSHKEKFWTENLNRLFRVSVEKHRTSQGVVWSRVIAELNIPYKPSACRKHLQRLNKGPKTPQLFQQTVELSPAVVEIKPTIKFCEPVRLPTDAEMHAEFQEFICSL